MKEKDKIQTTEDAEPKGGGKKSKAAMLNPKTLTTQIVEDALSANQKDKVEPEDAPDSSRAMVEGTPVKFDDMKVTERESEAQRLRQINKQAEDELYRKINGVFYFHGKETPSMYSKTSLGCLTDQNPLRYGAVWLMEWKWFDRLITLAILLNSCLLASTDFQDRYDPLYVSEWTPQQEKIDRVFTWVFIFECMSKVIGMGFVCHKRAYLRDSWNNLDFFIVCVSVVDLLGIESASLKALRTFRILRPLRSINAMPTMRDLIQSLLGSIPGLLNTIVFLAFIFSIFAIFGTNQFAGKTYQFCRIGDPVYNADGEFVEWPKAGADWQCMTDEDCVRMLGTDELYRCGSLYDEAKVDPLYLDDIRNDELILYGIPVFDNFGKALVSIFQVLTLESWSYMCYNYSDNTSPTTSVIFFVLVVVMGAFFTMNLVLAQIMDSFDKQQEAKEEALAAAQEEAAREAAHEKEKQREREKEKKKLKSPDTSVKGEGGNKIQHLNDTPERQKTNDVQTNLQPSQLRERIKSDSIEGISVIKQNSKGEDEGDVQKIINDLVDKPVIEEEFGTPEKKEKRVEEEEGPELFDEEEHERNSRIRSANNCCYSCLYKLATGVWFNFFIFCLILANTITLAVYTFDQSKEQERIVDIFNEFFTWAFTAEMILKIIGLGFGNYVKDSYNLFDCVIVIISLVDWTVAKIPTIDLGSALKALKALRLLRMMKLSKSWKALQDILQKTVASLKAIASFGMLLFLFMFIFALLGMELFAKKALLDEDENLVMGMENVQALYTSGDAYMIPRINFDNVGWSLISIFLVIVGEDWNWSMYFWTRAYSFYENPNEENTTNYWISVIYFILCMVLGNITLFSLFTAILLKNFEGGDEDEDAEAQAEKAGPKMSISQKLTSREFWDDFYEGFQEAFGKKQKIKKPKKAAPKADDQAATDIKKNEKKAEDDLFPFKQESEPLKTTDAKKVAPAVHKSHTLLHYDHSNLTRKSTIKREVKVKFVLEGYSLCCLGPENCFRKFVAAVASHQIFEQIILLLIIISTITLAMETPLDDPKGELIQTLEKIDVFMTTSFTIECLTKIIALGFCCNGKNSYIREAWNILDGIIVLSALIGIFAGDAVDISFLKALRILRIMRPLRLIARNQGLKVAITSLFNSIPSIVNLQIIVMFFLFLFAILQTTLFTGELSRCSMDHLDLSLAQQRELIVTQWDCLNLGGEWVTPNFNFNDTLRSMLTLFCVQSTEGWIDVMWDQVDAVGPYLQPITNNNALMAPYMCLLMIIIAMLFLNLFVGVVIETFNREKAMLTFNQLLKASQRSWIAVQLMTFETKPMVRLDLQGHSWFRMQCILMTQHRYFDLSIMIFIILNTFVLAFTWFMMPAYYDEPMGYINGFFVIIFTLECIFKVIAQRGSYFKEAWNLFDFTVVILTLLIQGSVRILGLGANLGSTSTILRTLRIGRVFRLVKRAKQLQIIFETLISSAPAMGSLGLLLMLLMFMSAIIGVSQFALVNLQDAMEMNYHVNFQTFGAAFLTLLRCATGEAWNSIMFDSGRPYGIMYQCEEDESYETIVARLKEAGTFDGTIPYDAPKGCGPTYVSFGFFLMFQVLVGQIFLNLFIAIIIDAFFGQNDLANLPLSERAIESFQRVWSQFDPGATHFIDITQLSNFLMKLAEDEDGQEMVMFPEKVKNDEIFRMRLIIILDIPTFKNFKQVMFYDVLQQLANQIVKLHHNRERIAENKIFLRVLKAMKQQAHDDTLQALAMSNVKSDYDVDFDELIDQISVANNKIELVKALKEKVKVLNKRYNNLVDTSESLRGTLKGREAQAYSENVKVYTTKHWIRGKYILQQFRVVMSNRKKNKCQVEEKLPMIHEVDSKIEQSQGRNMSVGKAVEEEKQESFFPDVIRSPKKPGSIVEIDNPIRYRVNESDVSVNEDDFSEAVIDTVFHNDKKHLK